MCELQEPLNLDLLQLGRLNWLLKSDVWTSDLQDKEPVYLSGHSIVQFGRVNIVRVPATMTASAVSVSWEKVDRNLQRISQVVQLISVTVSCQGVWRALQLPVILSILEFVKNLKLQLARIKRSRQTLYIIEDFKFLQIGEENTFELRAVELVREFSMGCSMPFPVKLLKMIWRRARAALRHVMDSVLALRGLTMNILLLSVYEDYTAIEENLSKKNTFELRADEFVREFPLGCSMPCPVMLLKRILRRPGAAPGRRAMDSPPAVRGSTIKFLVPFVSKVCSPLERSGSDTRYGIQFTVSSMLGCLISTSVASGMDTPTEVRIIGRSHFCESWKVGPTELALIKSRAFNSATVKEPPPWYMIGVITAHPLKTWPILATGWPNLKNSEGSLVPDTLLRAMLLKPEVPDPPWLWKGKNTPTAQTLLRSNWVTAASNRPDGKSRPVKVVHAQTKQSEEMCCPKWATQQTEDDNHRRRPLTKRQRHTNQSKFKHGLADLTVSAFEAAQKILVTTDSSRDMFKSCSRAPDTRRDGFKYSFSEASDRSGSTISMLGNLRKRRKCSTRGRNYKGCQRLNGTESAATMLIRDQKRKRFDKKQHWLIGETPRGNDINSSMSSDLESAQPCQTYSCSTPGRNGSKTSLQPKCGCDSMLPNHCKTKVTLRARQLDCNDSDSDSYVTQRLTHSDSHLDLMEALKDRDKKEKTRKNLLDCIDKLKRLVDAMLAMPHQTIIKVAGDRPPLVVQIGQRNSLIVANEYLQP